MNKPDQQKIEEKLKEKAKEIEAFVKEKPLLSVGIAFGLGFIISKIFNRKKS